MRMKRKDDIRAASTTPTVIFSKTKRNICPLPGFLTLYIVFKYLHAVIFFLFRCLNNQPETFKVCDVLFYFLLSWNEA